ncbi:MAG TPA: Spy/CpxP family protein refolding chaperone [Devosia sp.]|nr:Spy/CpxP family protein refolding chaperone [Devosia sp.]
MKSFAALALVTTLAFGLALPAVAQDAAPTATRQWQNGPRHFAPDRGAMPNRGMAPGGLLMLACSDKGAEALEIGLVRMSYRLDLSADQQKLFDALRTKALTTQTSFADTCKASRPVAASGTRPDALARMKAGIAIEQARLAALDQVLPDFEAFFNSLSDQQKANLLPHRGMGRMGQHGGMGHDAGRSAPAAPGAAQNS